MKRFLLSVVIFAASSSSLLAQADSNSILFFGDSITAGNGVAESEAFPALVQQKIDSVGLNYSVRNGGLSGETSAGGVRRVDWMMQQPVDIFVLELGGNDALRGIKLDDTESNLQQIINRVQKKYPAATIVIAGMQVPPNLGKDYTQQFKAMYRQLAQENDAVLIPFLLENVGGRDEMMQSDGLHPTVAGHQIVAKNVWQELYPILKNSN